jgi:hypothetical protein
VVPHDLIQLFEPKILGETNGDLYREFLVEEISDALFQIGLIKAPGPDGFLAWFFQKN